MRFRRKRVYDPFMEMVALAEKMGLGKMRVCLTHERVNVCRCRGDHQWSEDLADCRRISMAAMSTAMKKGRGFTSPG